MNKDSVDAETIHIDKDVLKSLMADFGMPEAKAMDAYYASATYARLADETTGLYLEPWKKIYGMLKRELATRGEHLA